MNDPGFVWYEARGVTTIAAGAILVESVAWLGEGAALYLSPKGEGRGQRAFSI